MLKTGIREGRSVHTFQLKSINDMLLKLGWEVGQLQRSHISKATDRLATSSYFAINGALTAFHICEWIWHCGSESQREIWGKGQRGGQPTKTNFQMHLRALCPSLSTCREIANSFKHYAADRYPDDTIKPASVWFTTMPAEVGIMRAGDALSADAAVLMISNGVGTVPVAHVLSVVHGFLDDFCELHGLVGDTDA